MEASHHFYHQLLRHCTHHRYRHRCCNDGRSCRKYRPGNLLSPCTFLLCCFEATTISQKIKKTIWLDTFSNLPVKVFKMTGGPAIPNAPYFYPPKISHHFEGHQGKKPVFYAKHCPLALGHLAYWHCTTKAKC
jgi:hypothetical protein